MLDRETNRRRAPGRGPASAPLSHRSSSPVLALQRSIGNRAVAQVLARVPARTGTVELGGVGVIKVKGGNLDEWTGHDAPMTVEVTSEKGKHSRKLQQLSDAGTRTDVKVTIAAVGQAGEQLNVGGGTLLEITHARIDGYALADGAETWRVTGFENVHRTKVTHKVS